MTEYWESRFRNEGAMWQFEPSDSAWMALDLFKSNNLNHILIPGMGYGRNAMLFYDQGFKITGIEISLSAINIAKRNGLNFKIHHGSVTSMPFDKDKFDAIYCYSLIHLLNKHERKIFLNACYNQLKAGGFMVFVLTGTRMSLFGQGKRLSKNRYEISKGLKVFFYDHESVIKEFSDYGLIKSFDIEEPVKYMKDQEPIKLKYVICRKD